MLCGLLTPTSGWGAVAGFDVHQESGRDPQKHRLHVAEVLPLRRPRGGREHRFLQPAFTAFPSTCARNAKSTCCAWPASPTGAPRITRLLAGGWKQRLALGCAILHAPRILFLDEPTSGVDPIARRSFWDLIYQLAEAGQTIFVTTHYMDEAEYCHRLALMYRGKLIALGVPDELKRDLHSHKLLHSIPPICWAPCARWKSEPGVLDVAVFGAGLHVNVDDLAAGTRTHPPRSGTSRIFRSSRLEPIQPTMEDVFVGLIEAEEQKNP